MSKEKLYTLIKSPIITEQTAQLGESLKQVVFKVDISANKKEIKKAVEKNDIIKTYREKSEFTPKSVAKQQKKKDKLRKSRENGRG